MNPEESPKGPASSARLIKPQEVRPNRGDGGEELPVPRGSPFGGLAAVGAVNRVVGGHRAGERQSDPLSGFALRLRQRIDPGPVRQAPVRQAPVRQAPIRQAPIRQAQGWPAGSVPSETPWSAWSEPFQDGEFEALALELHALQFSHNPAYRKLCESRAPALSLSKAPRPEQAASWMEIPAVPAEAFKELELTSLLSDERVAVFQSSGTTGQRCSRHFHGTESLALYESSLLSSFRRHMLPGRALDGSEPARDEGCYDLVCLTPGAVDAPRSSLVHMFEAVSRLCPRGVVTFGGRLDAAGAWGVDAPRVRAALEAAVIAGRRVLLLGTAFGFVHLLDAWGAQGLSDALPAGSCALETGGYKGRSRSLPKEELHAAISTRLGLPPERIVREYGMSELSSQAYDTVAGAADSAGAASARRFRFPPWARARVLSPESGREVAEGEMGLIRVWDLANVWSVLAVQTQDLGVRRGDGFELVGRAAAAEPRGCSLMSSEA